MEDRLKYRGNNQRAKYHDIRRRNKKKRRLWTGLLVMIILVGIFIFFDQKGIFDLFFKEKVSYDGVDTYVEMKRDEKVVSRENLQIMAQTLINHPQKIGQTENVFSLPRGPLSSAGFVDWVYYNVMGFPLSELSEEEMSLPDKLWEVSSPVIEIELKPGDLGFYYMPEGNKANHVGIYLGEIEGKKAFIHAGGVNYKAEGLEEGRIIISLNNTLKRNKKDLYGQEFSPAAGPSQFMYYRRPQVEFKN